MQDATRPAIETTVVDGTVHATVYGAIANWVRLSDPEAIIDKITGIQKKNKRGEPLYQWSTTLYIQKNCPGVEKYREAVMDLRKRELKGAGKLACAKDGDAEIRRLTEEMGKDPAKLQDLAGMLLIPANTMIQPMIHNEVWSGSIVVASISLATYEVDGTKGVKAYLNEIGRVADGTRIGGGPRAAVLTGVSFAKDDVAPPASEGAPAYKKDDTSKNPWE